MLPRERLPESVSDVSEKLPLEEEVFLFRENEEAEERGGRCGVGLRAPESRPEDVLREEESLRSGEEGRALGWQGSQTSLVKQLPRVLVASRGEGDAIRSLSDGTWNLWR